MLEHYQIKKKIAQNAHTATYLAIDKQQQQTCILKKLILSQVTHFKTIELFEREAKLLLQLDHPRIPKYLASFTNIDNETKEIYLVQEYLSGSNLNQKLLSGHIFTAQEVLQVAVQICDILSYLHHFSPALIHRDIKPSNIILTDDHQVYLVDFGAIRDAVIEAHSRHHSMTIIGTYGYMPFEQFHGHVVCSSDIYSLGITCIQLLTAQSPQTFLHVNLSAYLGNQPLITKNFAKLLLLMTLPDHQQRVQSAAVLQNVLNLLLQSKKMSPATWKKLCHNKQHTNRQDKARSGKLRKIRLMTLASTLALLLIVFFSNQAAYRTVQNLPSNDPLIDVKDEIKSIKILQETPSSLTVAVDYSCSPATCTSSALGAHSSAARIPDGPGSFSYSPGGVQPGIGSTRITLYARALKSQAAAPKVLESQSIQISLYKRDGQTFLKKTFPLQKKWVF